MGRGGARAPVEEKTLLAELGRLFHVARANAREQRITKSTAGAKPKTAVEAAAKRQHKSLQQRQQEAVTAKKSRKKNSTRGGTVWVILKGGFTRVPSADKTAAIAHNSVFRGRLSERRRVEALEAAEQYVQTAWQQAQEAGLLLEDGSGPSGDEGLQYLREQYAVAAAMLRREPVGAQLKRMVEQTIPSSMAAAAAAPSSTAAARPRYDRDQWAGFIARENAILNRFAAAPSAAAVDAGDIILHEASQVATRCYFTTVEPTVPHDLTAASAAAAGSSEALRGEHARDVLPCKCIVRVRGSGRQKHTAVLSTPKAANYFKTNFMQVVRKEVSGSKLPRGEDTTELNQQQQQQHVGSASAAADNAASSSSKKSAKRRQR